MAIDATRPHRNWELKGMRFHGRTSGTRRFKVDPVPAPDPDQVYAKRFERTGRPVRGGR